MSRLLPFKDRFRSSFSKKSLFISAALASGLLVSACQTTMLGKPQKTAATASPVITGSIGAATRNIAAATELSRKWQQDRKNPSLASNYAKSLTALGSHKQAFEVYEEAIKFNPSHKGLISDYGKALAGHGKPAKAQAILQKAIAMGPDAGLYSAQGIVLDKVGNHKLARQYYHSSLALQPGNASTLNNLGMSYMLSGDLKNAEATLREAMAQKNASERVRQNLILVVGLQGRFEDAKQISGDKVAPEIVEANMVYLRSMISQPNRWNDLSKIDGKKS